jgi:hypothetical protein
MLNWLKKHFIPHAGNDHHPHFLRLENIRTIILIIFMMELGVLALPFLPAINIIGNNYLASVLPAVLGDLTNQNRQSQNLNILAVSPALNKVAELKAKDMAEKSYFAHTSPEGKNPWYWFNLVGYKYEYAGENLAVDFTDSEDVTLAWMNSPTHKANIVKNAYTEMGTGIATGTFNGRETIFVAQVFGKPVSSNFAPKPQEVAKVALLPKATTTSILGASTKAKVSPEPATTSLQTPVISNIEVEMAPEELMVKTSILEKAIVSPRHIANFFFIILGALVALALLFKLSIGPLRKHPHLITNGLAVIVLLLGVYSVNNLVAKNKMKITVSFASFQGEQFDQNR